MLIALCWFPLTLSLLAINLSLLVSLSKKANAQEQMTQSVALRIAATSYGTEQVLGASVLAGDARTLLLTKFLTTHQSPLAEYADYIFG